MAEVDLTGIDPAFFPRMKLFLSADIIGSTAYKQPLDFKTDRPDRHGQWAGIIQGFYTSVREAFQNTHWLQAKSRLTSVHGEDAASRLLGEPPRFWKTIGDEVVFWKELSGSVQIWLTLACWMKTIETVRNEFADMKGDNRANRLDVKSAAWMAGFPVRNKVLLNIPSSDPPGEGLSERLRAFYQGDSTQDLDFIGPGIDVGFRVSGLASARKLTISLDVAYALARTHNHVMDGLLSPLKAADYFPTADGMDRDDFVKRLTVFYSGSEPLKGVLGGVQYPKFWISVLRHDSLERARVALYSKEAPGQSVEWPELQTFCDRFYEDRSKFVSRPFINKDPFLGEVPPNFREFLLAADPVAAAAAREGDAALHI